MIMTWIWVGFTVIAAFFALINGRGAEVSGGALDGAAQAVTLSLSIAGPLCLWSGVGKLMQALGLTKHLAKLLSPVLTRLFPSSKTDEQLAQALSANVCANLLGLGNAATPMGIQAAQRLKDPRRPQVATDQLCRLVVMNTASIQLLPTTIAAVRSAAGAASPFDILPCVWVTSGISVAAGLLAAWLFGRRGADG